MEQLFVELTVGLIVILLGWLHIRQSKLEEKIEECVPLTAFEEVKQDLKETIKLLTEMRVEDGKWQGLIQSILDKN